MQYDIDLDVISYIIVVIISSCLVLAATEASKICFKPNYNIILTSYLAN
jgi:hypothetical protein